MSVLEERVRRRRARGRLYLAAVVAVAVLLAAGLLNAALSGSPSDVPAPSDGPASGPPNAGGAAAPAPAAPDTPGVTGPEAAGPGAAAGPGPGGPGWDVVRERVIAVAPMPVVSAAAAAPQVLSARDPGPPIDVPAAGPGGPSGLVPGGFPATPPGAVAQLAALDTVALHDLNPVPYAAAYRSISLPGAPDPATTPLGAEVADTYQRISVSATEPAPIFSRWQLAGALVKGSSDGGAFVVVCVLGELEAAAQNSAAGGVGDCQAMRYVATDPGGSGQWRIAPGPPAAAAPDTWPGSDAALDAGYRPVTGAIPG